jgi:hypothetical protein
MKLLKGFHPSLYSEYLLALGEEDTEGDARGPGGDGKGTYARGLGETYGYPGDAKRLREKSKMKLWKEYFGVHGRNLTCELSKLQLLTAVLRYPPFQRLLQVGLPSRLRGELWETLSGSICKLLLFTLPYIQTFVSQTPRHTLCCCLKTQARHRLPQMRLRRISTDLCPNTRLIRPMRVWTNSDVSLWHTASEIQN